MGIIGSMKGACANAQPNTFCAGFELMTRFNFNLLMFGLLFYKSVR
jgi:hypothetical protein